MMLLRLASLAFVGSLAGTGPGWADILFVGPQEHQPVSVGITLHRGDVKRWAAKQDEIEAFCFFHAANIAHVDGHWYAINGLARSGIHHHWMEIDAAKQILEDGDRTKDPLRGFLYDINDKMNEACP